MRAKHSYREKKGLLWIACSECDRGGNGADNDKCSAGCVFIPFVYDKRG